MKIEMHGQKALVTGSTRGIGFAIAKGLAMCGAVVYVNGRNASAVHDAITRLQGEVPHGEFLPAPGDIASRDGIAGLTGTLPDIDILVCNAATFNWIAFLQSTDEDWQRDLDINLLSAVRLSRAYLGGMLARNTGRIILVASESGLNIPADMIHYGVSKAAEIALARGLAELTAGTGVTVNSVLPGPTASSGADAFLAEHAAQSGLSLDQAERHLIDQIRPTSLLKRMATMEEVANMVVYIASPLSSATNGAALRVEGGILRHPG